MLKLCELHKAKKKKMLCYARVLHHVVYGIAADVNCCERYCICTMMMGSQTHWGNYSVMRVKCRVENITLFPKFQTWIFKRQTGIDIISHHETCIYTKSMQEYAGVQFWLWSWQHALFSAATLHTLRYLHVSWCDMISIPVCLLEIQVWNLGNKVIFSTLHFTLMTA